MLFLVTYLKVGLWFGLPFLLGTKSLYRIFQPFSLSPSLEVLTPLDRLCSLLEHSALSALDMRGLRACAWGDPSAMTLIHHHYNCRDWKQSDRIESYYWVNNCDLSVPRNWDWKQIWQTTEIRLFRLKAKGGSVIQLVIGLLLSVLFRSIQMCHSLIETVVSPFYIERKHSYPSVSVPLISCYVVSR